MASTFDALLRLELQATGENTNTWGEKTNNNIELLADAIAGSTSISLAGSGDFTLSTANAAADQSRKAYLIFTGALTGNRNVIIPSSSKTYIIANNTTGSYTITIKTTAGTGAVIPQGFASIVACNGTDTILVNESNRVSKAGDTMTGFLTLNADPSSALHAATKQYVDAATGTDLSSYYTKVESDARFVNLAGSTMTGALTLPGNPTQALHAATKQYVDGLIGGSTIPAGIIAMWSGTLLTIPTGWSLCMTGDSEVLLADGTSRAIQEIVDGRQEVEVMAFNEDTGLLEPRKVIDWFVNDSTSDDYIRLKIFRGNSALGSKRSLDVTRDHPVWVVGKGWVKADEILPGDKVLLANTSFVENKPTEQYVTAVEINKLSASRRNSSRFHKRYDIKVEGLHSFIANGFVVHNCNGTNGTPDLRDRFVIGAGNTYSPGIIGGSASTTTSSAGTHTHSGFTGSGGDHNHGGTTGSTILTVNQIPSHDHGPLSPNTRFMQGAPTSQPDSFNGFEGGGIFAEQWWTRPEKTATTGGGQGHTHTIGSSGTHTHWLSINSDGAHTHTVSTLPPFYALAYIMKL